MRHDSSQVPEAKITGKSVNRLIKDATLSFDFSRQSPAKGSLHSVVRMAHGCKLQLTVR